MLCSLIDDGPRSPCKASEGPSWHSHMSNLGFGDKLLLVGEGMLRKLGYGRPIRACCHRPHLVLEEHPEAYFFLSLCWVSRTTVKCLYNLGTWPMHSIPINNKYSYHPGHFISSASTLILATEHSSCCACFCPFLCLMDLHSATRVGWSNSSDHGSVAVVLHFVSVANVLTAPSPEWLSLLLTLTCTALSLVHCMPVTPAPGCPQASQSPFCPTSCVLPSRGTVPFCLTSP